MSEQLETEIAKRRTFAIISHPDAGKTTLTEKLLLFGGAIQLAGTVKGRKAARHATSDWMELEKQRGISVTTSVMQFPYRDRIVNLLDTPGHEDFSEDTYRTLTAVDSALMVIDAAKGVEPRTIKLMDVTRLRATPIMTLINKLDRDSQDPFELLDNIETVLKIRCAPITWPLGSGKEFKGVYHLHEDAFYIFDIGKSKQRLPEFTKVKGLDNSALLDKFGEKFMLEFREQIDIVKAASHEFVLQDYLAAELTPVFFGSALQNFGIKELLDMFVEHAPAPQPRPTLTREVAPQEPQFSGFVFKIQANMDPAHRDRIAFMRVCSGVYRKAMKIRHLRIGRDVQINQALTFMAGARDHVDTAWPGDIIGLHNHGTIRIGDVFTAGEELKFTGIPNFAPELFRRVNLRDPLKMKALQKGLLQLAEEGATQVFRPLNRNDLILGAVGLLQFDVVAYRLKYEYRVECYYETISLVAARWVSCDDPKMLAQFKEKCENNLALDGHDNLIYLAPTQVNLQLTMERWPDIQFHATQEY